MPLVHLAEMVHLVEMGLAGQVPLVGQVPQVQQEWLAGLVMTASQVSYSP